MHSLFPAAALIAMALLPGAAALAQVESFINKPGSSVGPATKVVPTNCVQGPDGSLTCDTKLENPPSDTPAKPQYSPFKN
jgi:Tfp pilus assembly protein PilX